MMTGLDPDRVLQALAQLDSEKPGLFRRPADYSMPNVSAKVVRIIISYTDYVARRVWREDR